MNDLIERLRNLSCAFCNFPEGAEAADALEHQEAEIHNQGVAVQELEAQIAEHRRYARMQQAEIERLMDAGVENMEAIEVFKQASVKREQRIERLEKVLADVIARLYVWRDKIPEDVFERLEGAVKPAQLVAAQEPEEQECPDCGGRGYTTLLPRHGERLERFQCETCNETGFVTAAAEEQKDE